MSKVAVIGNGESRRNVNLQLLKTDCTLIGCNAIHRDIVVDHLICVDRRTAEEANNNPSNKNTLIYVREDWFKYYWKIKKNKNTRQVPTIPFTGPSKKDQPEHWGSGGYAILLAAQLGFDDIELYGFDLYPTLQGTVNNIYKGTEHYVKANSHAVDYSFWVYQISKIFDYYKNSKFVIRNTPDWKFPDEWKNFNVEFVAL